MTGIYIRRDVWTPDPHHRSSDPKVRCSRCTYFGLQSSFPRKADLTYLKTCGECTEKTAKQREDQRAKRDQDKENESPREGVSGKGNRRGPVARTHEARPTLSWADLSGLLEKHNKEAFEVDALVELPDEDEAEIMADDGSQTAKNIAKRIWDWTGYRFM